MIQFRVLGPLEVVCDDERVVLGGVKQRALLGRLLLEPNQVVSTSRLVDSLWADDEPPVTARKILQNSVWSLRSVLNSLPTQDTPPVLVTQPPGYMLSVDEGAVDLHVFARKLESGREKMANGLPSDGAVILRDALDLWRGDVLADLAEAGISWPESTLVEKTRTDALELYFEAKIESGHHNWVIGGLEKLLENEPLRERASGLLMLALYRSGRQTEALTVYSRTHTELTANFGLHPGPWLRQLQERILTHDPSLDQPRRAAVAVEDHGRADRAAEPAARPPSEQHADDDFMQDLLGMPDWLGATAPAQGKQAHRREATIMIVRAHVGAQASTAHPVGVDELLDGIHTLLRIGVECCGGEVVASVGSATIALFNLDDSRENAVRATQLALLLRDSLDMSDESKDGLTIRAMVATGDLQAYTDPSPQRSQVSVNGTLLDQCWETFPQVPVGTIWVSDRAKSLTSDQVSYLAMAGERPYWVAEARSIDHPVDTEPFMDREHEMEILQRMFHRVEQRGTPHLVTVLGDHGAGKSRLLMEFCAMVAEQGHAAPLVLQHRVSRSVSVDPVAVAAQLRSLHRKVAPAAQVAERVDADGGAEALVREISAKRPVVITVDDLHLADEATLGFFERLGAGGQPGKLLVVASASEHFPRRFPHWGRAQPNSTRILLEPLSVDAVGRLLENLAKLAGDCVPESTWRVFHRVFGVPDAAAAKRAWLMRALPLVVGTKTFPAEHATSGTVGVR